LGTQQLAAELTGSHLHSKLLLLVDSDQPDEREGGWDAVKFGSHVVEAVMTRNHGQDWLRRVLERLAVALLAVKFRLCQRVSAGNWGLPDAHGTISPCERFSFWYSICPQAGVQNFRQHLSSTLSGCPLSALKTGE